MALNIKKDEMDQAWVDRHKSDALYKYLYDIAKYQVSKKGISFHERSDYIQFAVMKCFKHQDSFVVAKGAAYSFFWKQISLAIIYKARKEARRNSKVKTIYVDQEKILDWIEKEHSDPGATFNEIVDTEELEVLRRAYKKYNSAHKGETLRPSRETAPIILKWNAGQDEHFLDKFTTLAPVFKAWVGA